MEDDEPAKPAAVSRQAAARREAALQRTAKWRNKNAVWPPPPVRQEVPRPVKPPLGLLHQVLVGACQFIGGLIYGSITTLGSSHFLSSLLPKHTPSGYGSHLHTAPWETACWIAGSLITVALSAPLLRTHRRIAVGALMIAGFWVLILVIFFR